MRRLSALFLVFLIASFSFSCRQRNANVVTIALDAPVASLDFLSSSTVDANAERLRSLMFNTLVKKNEKFEYVGELAGEIRDLDGGNVVSFVLRDNVKFQDGRALTANDVKYTFDKMLASGGAKATSFFENKQPQILEIVAPDAKTVNFRLARPALKNQLLSNLVAIPIIADGTFEQQKVSPLGSGAYKFVRFDSANNVIELAANNDYWEGAPNIQNLRVRAITDQNGVQAELQSGRLDLAPAMNNLPHDTIESLDAHPNLKAEKFPGANVHVLTMNTQSKPHDDVRVRQAIE